MNEKTYLFEYDFEGDTFGATVVARNEVSARLKMRAMANAQYRGEVAAIIPASPRGLWQRLFGTGSAFR